MSVNTIIKSIAISLIGSVLLYGCATQSLKLTVTRPAEINLKGFDKIAIGDIEDRNGQVSQHSRDISDKITSALFESKRFEVLDRQHLGTLLKEHNLTISGLVDEKTAAELGKFIGCVFRPIRHPNTILSGTSLRFYPALFNRSEATLFKNLKGAGWYP